MLKWLENPFVRNCVPPVLVYQSPYDSSLSSKRVPDRHVVASLAQLLVGQLCFLSCEEKLLRFRGILSHEA